jgi:hypothetical protein
VSKWKNRKYEKDGLEMDENMEFEAISELKKRGDLISNSSSLNQKIISTSVKSLDDRTN